VLEKKLLSKYKEAQNDTRVCKALIAKVLTNLVSTLECAGCELLQKSLDVVEKGEDDSKRI
jgi:hypothetical protein